MIILGQALSGWGIPFISAKAVHRRDLGDGFIAGEVVCETQEQCDAIASRAAAEEWTISTRVATDVEMADAKRWSEIW